MDFNWDRKQKYPSYLEVDLSFCNKSGETIVRKHFSRAPWEKEIDLHPYNPDPIREDDPEPIIPLEDNFKLKSWEKFLDLPS